MRLLQPTVFLPFLLYTFILFTACKEKGFIEEHDVFISGKEGSQCYRIPSLITTTKGSLIAVCDARRSNCFDAPNNIDLAMKRSFDNGKTWTPLKIIANYPGEEAAGDVSLTINRQTGTIWLFYNYMVPKPGFKPEMLKNFKTAEDYNRWRTVYLCAMRSDDDGENWSEPFNLSYLKKPIWDYLIVAPGNGIQSKNGRLLIATYASRAHLTLFSCQLIYSDDNGRTWKMGHSTGDYTIEPQLVELNDGSLMMNMRQKMQKGHRMYAVSKDEGITWSEPVDETTQPEPGMGCQASFIRFTREQDGLKENRLLFSNPASDKAREKMTIRMSYDEGSTWPIAKTIHKGPSAYSSMTILKDRSIGVLYEKGEKYNNEKISFARFNVEWLTEGKDNLDWAN